MAHAPNTARFSKSSRLKKQHSFFQIAQCALLFVEALCLGLPRSPQTFIFVSPLSASQPPLELCTLEEERAVLLGVKIMLTNTPTFLTRQCVCMCDSSYLHQSHMFRDFIFLNTEALVGLPDDAIGSLAQSMSKTKVKPQLQMKYLLLLTL